MLDIPCAFIDGANAWKQTITLWLDAQVRC